MARQHLIPLPVGLETWLRSTERKEYIAKVFLGFLFFLTILTADIVFLFRAPSCRKRASLLIHSASFLYDFLGKTAHR